MPPPMADCSGCSRLAAYSIVCDDIKSGSPLCAKISLAHFFNENKGFRSPQFLGPSRLLHLER